MNREIVRKEIKEKTHSHQSYYATNDTVKNVVTDFDNFPYIRFYRGVYGYPDPVIMEREAGFRKIKNLSGPQDYGVFGDERNDPRFCWENACSTTLPCRPKDIDYKEAKIASTNERVIISP